MAFNHENLRKAGSVAFFALKDKHKLQETVVKDNLTTVKLFGDNYHFVLDKDKKMLYMKSTHHYTAQSDFKLCTAHKEWEGVFSYPRQVLFPIIKKSLEDSGEKPEEENNYAKIIGGQVCKVISQLYKGNKKKITGWFGGYLWKNLLDREIACMAMKIYGLSASAVDYTLIWNNREEFEDTLKKAPSVIPIWRDVAIASIIANKKKPDEVVAQKLENLFGAVTAELKEQASSYNIKFFNYPKEATSFVFPDIIKTSKLFLEEQGLTNAGWKFLLKLSPRSVNTIKVWSGGTNLARLLNWLAVIGIVPRYSIIKPLMQGIGYMQRTKDVTAFMRAGLIAAQTYKPVRKFYENEFSLALDWFTRGGGDFRRVRSDELEPNCIDRDDERDHEANINYVKLDANQKKAPWAWFKRQQEIWHEQLLIEERKKQELYAKQLKEQVWKSLVPKVEIDGYQIIPILSTLDLQEEGLQMSHCVGSYSYDCLRDYKRIFSVRSNGDRKATLSIRAHQDSWNLDQIRGFKNSEASDDVKKASEKLLIKYNKAQKMLGKPKIKVHESDSDPFEEEQFLALLEQNVLVEA